MSAQSLLGVPLTFAASGAIAEGVRVKVDSAGTVTAASATEWDIGQVTRESLAAGDYVTVSTPRGIEYRTASKAIAVGAVVYKAAAGKVTDSAGTAPHDTPLGVAVSAAAADGDLFRVVLLS